MLSRLDVEISKSGMLDFETSEFDSEEYEELKKTIRQMLKLPIIDCMYCIVHKCTLFTLCL